MKRTTVDFDGSRPMRAGSTQLTIAERFCLREVLAGAVRRVGEELLAAKTPSWEGLSVLRNHAATRSDLEATGLLLSKIMEHLSIAHLDVLPSFESEELPLVPVRTHAQRYIRLIADPIDGTKAFDNARAVADCPVPRPSSAVSVAAVCPVSKRLLASAVYLFDLGEVFSSVCLEECHSDPCYAAFRNEVLLPPITNAFGKATLQLQTKKRILNGNYNSRALSELALFEMALTDVGLKPNYGGLSGSSATDIINVARGSYAACVDVRALCRGGGSVPHWYDVAGVVPIARGRGLRVILVRPDGEQWGSEDVAVYERVSFIVARGDVVESVVAALVSSIAPNLQLVGEPPEPTAGSSVAVCAGD